MTLISYAVPLLIIGLGVLGIWGIVKFNQWKRDKRPVLLLGHLENGNMSVAQCQFCTTIFLYPRKKVPVKCPKCGNIKIPE